MISKPTIILTLEKKKVKPTEKKVCYFILILFLMPRPGAEEKVKERTSK